ncbi:DUF192 domain-containing protein [bacterium]|nr:DUF192 domain-containing protein [bacterium]
MSAWNITRHAILGDTLLTLSSNFQKILRHINKHGIPNSCALWLFPCSGIYTVGMKKPVDIIFINKDRKIVKMLRNFPPGCFAESTSGAIGALELPPNTLTETNSHTGDTIELNPG